MYAEKETVRGVLATFNNGKNIEEEEVKGPSHWPTEHKEKGRSLEISRLT